MNVMEFKFVADLLRERSGLVLGEEKAYLLESRLNPVARKWNFKGFEELAAALRSKTDEKLISAVVDAMTTNESFFFRDQNPFRLFEELVLPELLTSRASAKRIRIWCAACSSGQEPYSLAMILSENAAKLKDWKVEIVATDLSGEILEKAKAGVYTQFEVQRGLPINLLVKYFSQADDKWKINQSLRDMVSFRSFNLLDSMTSLGKFDVVFCRNVLIYFDAATKKTVLEGIAKVMAPDGVLYLGGAETVLGICDRFQPIPNQRGIYGLSEASGTSAARGAA